MSPESLTQILHAEIPLSAFMEVRVAELDAQTTVLCAPFEPNRNLHGTGFAGSLYTLCVLTGWSAVTAHLDRCGLKASVVAHKAEIHYLKPIIGELRAECRYPEAEILAHFEKTFVARHKARLSLGVSLGEAVRFSADFIAIGETD